MASTDRKLRDFLLAQSAVWLTDRLLDAAASDPVLLTGLQVAASGSDGVQVVRRELDRALRVDTYVEEDDAPTYVYQADRALSLVEDMVRDGSPDDAIEVAEHAIGLLRDAVECVYDEGETQGCLAWAQEIHARACAAGDPDPTALAERLFAFAVADEWGVFVDVLNVYADVLGPSGLARLRGLIGEAVERFPRLAVGARPDSSQSAILELAERAARADGVDAVVDVLARDLGSAHRFERICHELASAGRIEEALGWARRGLVELDPHVGQRQIRRTAAALAGRLGRHSEAAEWVWEDFAKSPSLEGGTSACGSTARPTTAGPGGAVGRFVSCGPFRGSRDLYPPDRRSGAGRRGIPNWSPSCCGRAMSRPRGGPRSTVAARRRCG